MKQTEYTSIKVPKILSDRFETAKNNTEAWEGYRSFSEFVMVLIRIGVVDYEKKIEQRNRKPINNA